MRAILAPVATKAQVERTLAELIKRFHGADVADTRLPEERKLVCYIRDLELFYSGMFVSGRVSAMAPEPGAAGADVLITVTSDDLVALADGRLSPVYAFLSGKLRVDAGARDLMLIRQLF